MFELVKKWIYILLPLVFIWSFVILIYNAFIFDSDTYYLIDFTQTFDYINNHKMINFDFVDMFTGWISDLSKVANNFKNIELDSTQSGQDILNILYTLFMYVINYIIVPLLYVVSLLGYVLNFFVSIGNVLLNFIYICINPIFYNSGIKKDMSSWLLPNIFN
jgi:hypothetical protein